MQFGNLRLHPNIERSKYTFSYTNNRFISILYHSFPLFFFFLINRYQSLGAEIQSYRTFQIFILKHRSIEIDFVDR